MSRRGVWALLDGRLSTEVRMRRLTVLLTVAGFVVLVAADGLAQAPSTLGTWTLNVAKSKYDPGPAPKSQTTRQEGVPGGGMKAISDQVDASGRTIHTEITTMFDGKRSRAERRSGSNDSRLQAHRRSNV